jgi:hypothetical protein
VAAPSPSIRVCGIGASAGGVEALQQLFSVLPTDLGLAYVVVLQLAPDRKSELDFLLGRWTTMPVRQVVDHDTVKLLPDHVYVIAPDRQLEITDSSVTARHFEEPRGHRAAIDTFFRSLAAAHGDGFAVILSGSGSDGALGARAIKARGGLVLVQDPAEARHGSMPRSVMATGAADMVLPIGELAVQLAELARSKDRVEALLRPEEAPPVVCAGTDHRRAVEPVSNAPQPDHRPALALHLSRLPRRAAGDTRGGVPRFRCHAVHAYSIESLTAVLAEKVEEAMWSAIRALDESGVLLAEMARHLTEHADDARAALLHDQAAEARRRADAIKRLLA